MAMSDRIIVMWQGEIAQAGRPGDIYRHPQSSFVADFIGRSNLIPLSTFRSSVDGTEILLGSTGLRLISSERPVSDQPRFLCIRPEALRITGDAEKASTGTNRLTGKLRRIVNLGAQLDLSIEVAPELSLSVVIPSSQSGLLPEVGEECRVFVAAEDVTLLSH